VFVKSAGNTQYDYSGSITRFSTDLTPYKPTMLIYPDKIAGNDYDTYTTNLIITFKLLSAQILSLYENNARM
jgi:hypothetical protein